MADLTFHTGLQMFGMAEENEVGETVEAHPRDRPFFRREAGDSLNGRSVFTDADMALHTPVCRRETGPFVALDRRVTIDALRSGGRMQAVAERHWLRSYCKRQLLLNTLIAGLLRREDLPAEDSGNGEQGWLMKTHGSVNATSASPKEPLYLFPPPAATTTNCFPDFLP